ncbi:MAG: PKD domain-containing protein, partial [Thermoplasmata archaeon]|nr:PKD domain-containing protein [Thermoplasmata archaeon]
TDGNHTHVYPDEGLFTAVLKVTDNRGEVGIATVNIKVDRDAPDDDPADDTEGAAVCCAVTVVILVVVAYWALRRSMVTPRKDGGPLGPPEGVGPEDGTGDGGEPEPAPSDD